MTPARHFVRSLIRRTPHPLKRAVLRRAALAPPVVKTGAFEHIFRTIAETLPSSEETYLTNLGLAKQLRCHLPIAKAQYVLGRPQDFLPERATLALATELAADCTHFLDVGANDGLFTFSVAGRKAEISLHWFEPNAALYSRLGKNLADNDIPAAGSNAAVADRPGSARFFRNLGDDSTGSLREAPDSGGLSVEQVRTISLSDYFMDFSIDNALVKIDVEGAGESVWIGARDIASRIRHLIIEIIGPETECGLPGRIISESGLYGYYINDFRLIHSRDGSFTYMAPFWNWLFTRLSPEQLALRLASTTFRVA